MARHDAAGGNRAQAPAPSAPGLPGPGRGILVPRLDRIYAPGLEAIGQGLNQGIAHCTGSNKPLQGIPGATPVLTPTQAKSLRRQTSAILVRADLTGLN